MTPHYNAFFVVERPTDSGTVYVKAADDEHADPAEPTGDDPDQT